MRYFGGKNVIGKQISNVILENTQNHSNTIYIELFCGSCGVMKHLTEVFKKTYANDISTDLIMLLKQLKKNEFKNPKINRDKWKKLKYTNISSPERAFAGFGCSYGGVWFNGYISEPSNNDMEYSTLIKLSKKIQSTTFTNKHYIDFLKDFKFDSNQQYVFYLDPPYKDTVCSPLWPKFDSEEFWNIVIKLGKMKNITIFVSEFSAPKGVKCIFEIKRRTGMHNITNDKLILTDKLFCIKQSS